MNTSTRNHAVALLSKRLWIYTTSCDTTLNPFSSRRLASCRARLRAATHTDRLGQCHPGRVNSIRRGATASGRSSAERPGPRLLPCKFKVSGKVCDPNYRLRDGDAVFLEVGTPIYQVNGQPTRASVGGPLLAIFPIREPDDRDIEDREPK